MRDPVVEKAMRAASAVGRVPNPTVRAPRASGGGVDAPGAETDFSKPRPNDLGLYSHASVTAANMPMAKGSPEQIKGYLLKNGVKPDEMKWSGYDQTLGTKPVVTRDEVARHFHRGLPKISETLLGDDADASYPQKFETDGPAKYGQYTLPGGRNYRESLLALPPKMSAEEILKRDGQINIHNKGEISDTFTGSHWDQPNVLAHLRLSDRGTGKDKALHLEEMQSDWAQEGRKKGFKDPERSKTLYAAAEKANQDLEDARTRLRQGTPDNDEVNRTLDPLITTYRNAQRAHINSKSGVPHAPYVDSTAKWTDLGLKRLLHEAASKGYHRVLITPGEQQAARYDLSKHIDEVTHEPWAAEPGKFDWTARKDNGIVASGRHTPDEIAQHLGKDIADKIANGHGEPNRYGIKSLSGLDLKVGGEGMKAFYDKMLPQALTKLARRHDPAAEVKLHGHALVTGKPNPLRARLTDMGYDPDEVDLQTILADHGGRKPASLTDAHMDAIERGEHQNSDAQTTKLHSLDITPKMRASILRGQPAYASGGAVGGDVERQEHTIGGKVHHLYERVSHPDPPDVPALARGGATSKAATKAAVLSKIKKPGIPSRSSPLVDRALEIARGART